MCGIVGVLRRNDLALPDRELLAESAALLAHRGPDNTGLHTEPGLGLAQTRLALLDLSPSANQPWWDERQRYAIVYNGEVYNFRDLRRGLEDQGHRFVTTCDTEVVLRGCLHEGVAAFAARLLGMFAFALWDRVEGRLTLVRDRFGIKPLHYVLEPDRLIFASEVKALQPWLELAPDLMGLAAYLGGFGGPMRESTLFSCVRTLPPGEILTVERGREPRRESFGGLAEAWEPDRAAELARRSPAALVDELDELLRTSVERHLLADAPVGALCSGGVDSSLILAMAARSHPNLAVFHADVEGPLSERPAATRLAQHLGLEMAHVTVRDSDFVEHLPEVVWHYEQPFTYHPNSIPFLLVARIVRRHGVKAVLSGEGADECFLGYRWLPYVDLSAWYRRQTERLGRAVRQIRRIGPALWPPGDADRALTFGLMNRFEQALDQRILEGSLAVHGGSAPQRRDLRTLELLSYHLRTLLHRNDRLGMAASIEARFPFLDHDVVRFAVNAPYSVKIRKTPAPVNRSHPFIRDKWVLRQVARRYLPRSLGHRKKLGFPTNAYRRVTITDDYLAHSTLADTFELSQAQLGHWLEAASPGYRLRMLLVDVWTRLFLRGEKVARLQASLEGAVRVTPTTG